MRHYLTGCWRRNRVDLAAFTSLMGVTGVVLALLLAIPSRLVLGAFSIPHYLANYIDWRLGDKTELALACDLRQAGTQAKAFCAELRAMVTLFCRGE